MKKILAASSMMLMFAAAGVSAQEGTLAKIAELGEISVGHRDGAVPFSYYDDQQRPVGYAMDLCAKVVEAIYLGQMVRYHLAIEGEETRPMVATVPFVGRAYATGESVKVSWDAADLWPVAQ